MLCLVFISHFKVALLHSPFAEKAMVKTADFTLFFFFVVVFSQSLLLAQSQPPGIDPQDKASLLIFRVSIHDPNRSLSTWYGSSCSNWTGIACQNPTGRVISSLYPLRICPVRFTHLCKLTSLQILDLSGNNFSGNIPTCFGALRSLRTLNLSRNSLVGSIPGTFVNLKELREVVLSENRGLRGSVPLWVGELTNLERIDLSFCSFLGDT
ncbi:hypothetical protein Bca52824_052166 [Brassica carinata]|uniref:Leucine-rich repeat-containing N-terminal plant-type domain-containing protein n=1 Tax=Brassica carinata TaxID=52824 RepID=A0A8X7R382_BRACI|nr:hypothetical protein Bca52824_052166 [Brassica carinata]